VTAQGGIATAHSLRVAIVGGGIGGLCAAAALRRQGISATVYEQAPAVREVGAGLGLAPNGRRLLERLGLGTAIRQRGAKRDGGIVYFRHDGETVGHRPIDPDDCSYGMHRADLAAMLLSVLPQEAVATGHRCVGFEQDEARATLAFSNGRVVEADVVVGADGIHSFLQGFVVTPSAPQFAGYNAYRGLVSSGLLRDLPLNASVMWMGDRKHFLVYPVRSAELLNYVAFIPAADGVAESWSAAGDPRALAQEFEGWDPRVRRLIESIEATLWWGLYDREPLSTWTNGRLALLGDAAHPMLPHAGQGANQAIEDGFVLANALRAETAESVPVALARYAEVRCQRAGYVQKMSRRMGRLYDSARDRNLDARDAEVTTGDYSKWVYGYDAEVDALT
jgi:salicylate hydroxylase